MLTLTLADGRELLPARHVWLIGYPGLDYTASEGCSCYTQHQPNTLVALDAGDGRALLAFGTE
jgi:hypothetical protein